MRLKISSSVGFFLLGVTLSSFLLWPFFYAPYFTHHDDVQAIRIYEMSKCLKDHQIPCRWVPDLGNGFGLPIFNYYAPVAYYVGGLFYLIFNNLILSTKLIFIFPFIGSYIFMFFLGQRLWGAKGGFISGVFYCFAPYHSLVTYVRGAMGELWAMMFFPALFWSVLRLNDKQNGFNVILCACFTAFLILSHNLSAMLFLPIVFLFVLILSLKEKNKNFLIKFFYASILGLLLSSFYWLPMSIEKPLVHVESTTVGYFSYTEHFKGLKKLFLDRSWGWGASVREVPGGEKDGLSFQIGIVHVICWLLSIWFWIKAKLNKKSVLFIFVNLCVLFSIYMVNPRSVFLWKLIEPLKYLQFPWRFLILATFFISLIIGSITKVDFKRKNLFLALAVVALVSLNFLYFRPEKSMFIDDNYLLSGKYFEYETKRSTLDFLPKTAKEPPPFNARGPYELITGDTKIAEFKQGTNWMSFKADTRSHSIIRLSSYFFPDWRIKIDDMIVNIDYKNVYGLMTVILGPGNHKIETKLNDTPVRILGNMLSVIGAISIVVIWLLTFSGTKKRIYYYARSFYK